MPARFLHILFLECALENPDTTYYLHHASMSSWLGNLQVSRSTYYVFDCWIKGLSWTVSDGFRCSEQAEVIVIREE